MIGIGRQSQIFPLAGHIQDGGHVSSGMGARSVSSNSDQLQKNFDTVKIKLLVLITMPTGEGGGNN